MLFADVFNQIEQVIHRFRLHRAVLDIDELMRVLPIISSQDSIAALWMLNRELSFVAVMQILLRSDNWFDDARIQLADVLQRLFDDVFFGSQLIFIRHVLPLAAATNLEHRAQWLGSVLRRLDYVGHFSLGKVFANIEQFDLDNVTGHNPIDEDRRTEALCNALTSRSE